MIFSVPNHIDYIRNGLPIIELCKPILVKTQTRRPNRGVYRVGRSYSVQPKRGVKAVRDMRIVIDEIWLEDCKVSVEDAWAEGGYMPSDFEEVYAGIYPKSGSSRWAFKFHAVKVVEEEGDVV